MQQEAQEDEEEQENIQLGDAARRISLLNVDWENFKAKDIFFLFNSLCTGSQRIVSVTIYPSEYGKKELEREQLEGPDKDIFIDNERARGNGFDAAKLRAYELKRMKYYYAVCEFDSVATADAIYEEWDGTEIEKTQSFLDLRFIPDSLTEFPYEPHDFCDKIELNYEPRFRQNKALTHTDCEFTWDQGDLKREEVLKNAFDKADFNEDEIRELIASDSEDEELAKAFESEEEEKVEGKLLNRKKNREFQFKEGEEIEFKFNTGIESVSSKLLTEEKIKMDKSKFEIYNEKRKDMARTAKLERMNKKYNQVDIEKAELELLTNRPRSKQMAGDDNRFANNHPDYAVDPTKQRKK